MILKPFKVHSPDGKKFYEGDDPTMTPKSSAQGSEELVERMRETFRYDAETGILSWAKSVGKVKSGDLAGWKRSDGYLEVKFDGKSFRVHRIAWMLVHGEELNGEIDHINHDPSDNRLINLRIANREENNWNTPLRSTNKSGVKGVCFHKDTQKWEAYFRFDGNRVYVGLFETIDEASDAVRKAREQYHGEFAHHG